MTLDFVNLFVRRLLEFINLFSSWLTEPFIEIANVSITLFDMFSVGFISAVLVFGIIKFLGEGFNPFE